MAGFRYWMVLLPEWDPASFLLFVDNQNGSTKLRSYAGGGERTIGQPAAAEVFARTEPGRTRHEVSPHTVTDGGYWTQLTQEYNHRFLGAAPAPPPAPASGRATRGSQRQMQDYVAERPDALSAAVLAHLPPAYQERGATLRWVSPLAADGYREYRDAAFLERLGLAAHAPALARFWPNGGPVWDALGLLKVPGEPEAAVLVEAKSHIPEIYGNGCQASAGPRVRIEEALASTRDWTGAAATDAWTGRLYQYANRLAHLYWFREIIRHPAWLVQLAFVDDPIGPTSAAQWQAESQSIFRELGLSRPVPHLLTVSIPAFATSPGFAEWADHWMALAAAPPGVESVLAHWHQPIPGPWQRDIDARLRNGRYQRSDAGAPRNGEHAIEHAILSAIPDVRCFGYSVVDGVNAVPLSRDSNGGRRGNVEADLLLLLRNGDQYALALCEVKSGANDPWYAVVENLRQYKLLVSGAPVRDLFQQSRSFAIPGQLPVFGVVVAPRAFYARASLPPAQQAIAALQSGGAPAIHLGVWDPDERAIVPLSAPTASAVPR